jgi:hypothetical protein
MPISRHGGSHAPTPGDIGAPSAGNAALVVIHRSSRVGVSSMGCRPASRAPRISGARGESRMREVSRHLFIPRRPLIASML